MEGVVTGRALLLGPWTPPNDEGRAEMRAYFQRLGLSKDDAWRAERLDHNAMVMAFVKGDEVKGLRMWVRAWSWIEARLQEQTPAVVS